MMKKNIVYLIIIYLTINSCVNSPNKYGAGNYNFVKISKDSIKEISLKENNNISVKIPKKFETLNLDNAIKEMKYIPLETNSNSIIGRIDKLEIHDDKIYVLDKAFSQSIYVFDILGNHLNTLNRKGNGPHEYVQITDFCYKNDTLIIYDGIGAKLLYFNSNCEFLFEKRTGFHFRNLKPFNNGDYLIVTKNAPNTFIEEIDNYSILIGEPDSIVKYKGFINNTLLASFEKTTVNPIVEYDEGYLFSPLLSNNIYQIYANGDYSLKYKINFNKGLPQDYYKKVSSKDFEKYVKRNNYSYFMGTFAENRDHLFLRFNPPGEYYGYAIFNKINSSTICYDGTKSPDYKYWGISTPYCVYDNFFVGALEPINVLNKKKKILQNPNITYDNKEILSGISENDNPIIIFFSFN